MLPGRVSLPRRILGFFRSIRLRLALWSGSIMALILLVFCIFVYTRQAQDLQTDATNRLAYKTQQVVNLLRVASFIDEESDHPVAPELLQRESDLLYDYEQMALIGPDGSTVQNLGGIEKSTIDGLVATWQENSQGNKAMVANLDQGTPKNPNAKTNYIFLVTPLVVDRHTVGMVILGRPLDPENQMPRLIVTLALASFATLALVLAGGYWLAGRAMAPVRTITRTARGISETDLNQRLRLGTHDELGELADTFDDMLDRLQAAFDRQRQFTADASHELRTPLTIVGLETDLALARRRGGDEYERAMRVIKSENEFMAHLVNDLLTLARMDAGQTQIRREPLDLSDVTLDVVERLMPIARRDGVELITGDLPEIMLQGDRATLTQMITNLVENAIKYSGVAGKHVWVSTGTICPAEDAQPDPAQYSWVRVADDGPGIPEDHLPHLFERFYRVDSSRTRRLDRPQPAAAVGGNPAASSQALPLTTINEGEKTPDGSGLGLAIVKWIAQAHGGIVSVQSEVGKGSTFEVHLPCK